MLEGPGDGGVDMVVVGAIGCSVRSPDNGSVACLQESRRNTSQAALCAVNVAKGKHDLRTCSEYDDAHRRPSFGHPLQVALEDPIRQVAFFGGACVTGVPKLAPKNRAGRPRVHWMLECYSPGGYL